MPQSIPTITTDLALEWAAVCMQGEEAEEAWLDENIQSGRVKLVPMSSPGDPRVLYLDDVEVGVCSPKN
jgi:hypothetical protein